MTAQRVRPYNVITPGVQPDNTVTGNIVRAIVAGLLIIGVIVGMRWWGERNAAQPSAPVQAQTKQVKSGDPPVSHALTTGAQTIKIPTGMAEYPNLTLTVAAGDDGWNITDEDGDKGWCPMKPATLDDLEHCRHIED